MSVNITTLMTRLGHFFNIGEGLASAFSTASTRINTALSGLGSSLPAEYEAVRASILNGKDGLERSLHTAIGNEIQAPAQQLILLTVSDDQPQASTIPLAITELIRQFVEGMESFEASSVGSSVSYDSANTGNGVAILSTKRADGTDCLFAFAEVLEGLCSVASSGEASFGIIGPPDLPALDPAWPGGSGADVSSSSRTASSSDNKVTNGTFEQNNANSVHLPSGWLAPTATLGTTLKMSSVEVQTVTISGTPTSGFYTLSWANGAGQTQTTVPLSWDADESAVQSALRDLTGLGSIDVSTSGTSPNFVHTVTFNNVTNPAQLTSSNFLDTGSIAHATTTAGSANVMRGARAVEFDSNGSELTTLMVEVALDALTQYGFGCFAKVDSVPAAGVLTVDLVDGIGGTVLNDEAGNSNTFTIAATGLTTSFVAKTGVFRTPANMSAQVYLRIRISTAVSNTSSIFFDEIWLGEMDELYTDGPSVVIFDGSTPWLDNDIITLTITNDRAGLLHEWMDRVLGLRTARLQFPTSGSPTQADSLVA